MAKTKKNKKTQAPKIAPRLLARPRLDALFDQKMDLDGLEAGVRALMAEAGQPAVLDALIKRLDETPADEREPLMLLLPRLKSPEMIAYLWQHVKKPGGFSVDFKMMVLITLKQMGEEVDIETPGLYFSPREINPGNIRAVQGVFRTGMLGIARELRQSNDPAEVEAFMHRVTQMPREEAGGNHILLEFIKSGEQGATDLDADFIYALAHTTPFPEIQQKAEQALKRMAVYGIKPVTRAILDLTQDRFYGAYTTDPNHPWQQNVTVAWERAGGVIQALVFLLDFGVPWRGAIKDMFATRSMTPKEFKSELVDKPGRDNHMFQTRLARVQAMIADAVEANRKYRVALPREFKEVRHLVDRWVLHPTEAALAADSTLDELGDSPLAPDRGDNPLMLDLRDLGRKGNVRRWSK